MLDQLKDATLQTSFLEWSAVVCALLYVVLAAKEIIWCWLFGIISSALYVYICYESKLYLETVLSVFYVIMGFYGWYEWKNVTEAVKPVLKFSLQKLFYSIFIIGILSVGVGFIFSKYTNASQPYLDAPITLFSFFATWMAAKKFIENWIFWIVIDAASIFLFANRELYLTSVLYLLYTLLAAYGYTQWRKTK